jgi:hypothetical protein
MVMELMEGIMEATMEVMVQFTMYGCKVFLVHLSLASLKGLHPHHNTTILGLQHLKYLTRNESFSSNSFNAGWYPDSGATHHVTPDAHNLVDVVSLSGSNQVHIGNGQGLPIASVGSMSISSPFGPTTTLKLNNLLHVPSKTKNLVSVSQFAKDNNVFFEFHSNLCYV